MLLQGRACSLLRTTPDAPLKYAAGITSHGYTLHWFFITLAGVIAIGFMICVKPNGSWPTIVISIFTALSLWLLTLAMRSDPIQSAMQRNSSNR